MSRLLLLLLLLLFTLCTRCNGRWEKVKMMIHLLLHSPVASDSSLVHHLSFLSSLSLSSRLSVLPGYYSCCVCTASDLRPPGFSSSRNYLSLTTIQEREQKNPLRRPHFSSSLHWQELCCQSSSSALRMSTSAIPKRERDWFGNLNALSSMGHTTSSSSSFVLLHREHPTSLGPILI